MKYVFCIFTLDLILDQGLNRGNTCKRHISWSEQPTWIVDYKRANHALQQDSYHAFLLHNLFKVEDLEKALNPRVRCCPALIWGRTWRIYLITNILEWRIQESHLFRTDWLNRTDSVTPILKMCKNTWLHSSIYFSNHWHKYISTRNLVVYNCIHTKIECSHTKSLGLLCITNHCHRRCCRHHNQGSSSWSLSPTRIKRR